MSCARWIALRLLTAAALTAAVWFPLSVTTGPGTALAGCQGQGIPVGLNAIGAPFTQNCDLVVTPPPAIGAAPSAGAIVACRGIPGCLAMWVNNPGAVRVPVPDTRPRSNGH